MNKKKVVSPYAFPGIRRESLPKNFNQRVLGISPEDVLKIVSSETFVSVEDILSTSRKGEVIVARHILCGLLKKNYNYAYTYIAKMLKRDHTTIIWAVKNFDSRKQMEEDFRDKTNRILERINSNN